MVLPPVAPKKAMVGLGGDIVQSFFLDVFGTEIVVDNGIIQVEDLGLVIYIECVKVSVCGRSFLRASIGCLLSLGIIKFPTARLSLGGA